MANNVSDIIVLSDDDEPKGPVPDDIIVVPDSDDDDPEGQDPDIDDDNPEGQGPDIDVDQDVDSDDNNPEQGQGPDIDNPEGQGPDIDDDNPEGQDDQDVDSDDNNPEGQGPDSDNGNDNKRRRRRGGIYKMWLFCDELLIMTTLATERHRSGRELSNADLYRAVRGALYRKTASKAAVASKVHGLKTKFRKAFARGGPSNKDRDQRLFDLSMVAWPELMQE